MGNFTSNITSPTPEQFLGYSKEKKLEFVEKNGFDVELKWTHCSGLKSSQPLIRYLIEENKFATCIYLFEHTTHGHKYISDNLNRITENNDSTLFEFVMYSHCVLVADYLLNKYRSVIENNIKQIMNIISDFKEEDVINYDGNLAMTDYIIGRLIENPNMKSLLMKNDSFTYANLVYTTDMKYFGAILDILKKHGLHTYLLEGNRFVNHLRNHNYMNKINVFVRKFGGIEELPPNYLESDNPPPYECI